jgi:hypothetical protein
MSQRLRRLGNSLGGARFWLPVLLGLALYLPRTATTFQHLDSAEFLLSAETGARLHPPGFPYFAFLLRGMHLALGGGATFFAVFNALLQAVAAGLAARWTRSLAAGCAWALYPATAATATTIEVFALHHCLALVALLLSRGYRERPGPGTAAALGLAVGLAGAHHPIAILMLPLCLPAARHAGPWLGAAGAALSGYGLLWLQSDNPWSFGAIESAADVVRYAMRSSYGTLRMSVQQAAGRSLAPFLAQVSWQLPCALLGPLSAAMAWRAPAARRWFICFILSVAFLWALRIPTSQDGLDIAARFWPWVALLWLGGLTWCRWPRLAWACVAATLVASVSAWQDADARRDQVLEAGLTDILTSLPAGATWVLDGDSVSFGTELLQARGIRPDVRVIIAARMDAQWYRRRFGLGKDWLPAVLQGSVYTRPGVVPLPAGYFLRPAERLWRVHAQPPPDAAVRVLLEGACATWPPLQAARNLSAAFVEAYYLDPVRQAARNLGAPLLCAGL